MIFMLIGSTISLMGVLLVYNARKIVRKMFSFGEENYATSGIKMIGFVLAMIGAFVMFFGK